MLACFLCASDLVISASCLASRLICFCFTSCTFSLRKLQHLVRHLLFFAFGKGASFTYMALVLKCTLSVLQSRRSGFGISCGIGLSVLQSQAFLFETLVSGTLFLTPFLSLNLPFLLLQIHTGFDKAKTACVKNKTLQENPPAYIYIYISLSLSVSFSLSLSLGLCWSLSLSLFLSFFLSLSLSLSLSRFLSYSFLSLLFYLSLFLYSCCFSCYVCIY